MSITLTVPLHKHVAALALQALKPPLACSTIVTLQMSTLLTVHVAAQALQALEAPRLSTDLSFKVVNLAPSSSRCKYNSIGRQETCNIPKRYQHS